MPVPMPYAVTPQPKLPPLYNVSPPSNFAMSKAVVEAPQTREEWERKEWDHVRSIIDSETSLHNIMLYATFNRLGLRMEGIEKKIETLLAEKWKEKTK
jgi:hypothetical protein